MMMLEKFTQNDAVDAARIVNRRRPDWDQSGIVAAFAKVRYELAIDHALAAALAAAADRNARTPDALTWAKYRPVSAQQMPDGRMPKCRDHPWLDAANCRCCWSEVKTGMRPESQVGKHHEASADAGAISLPETEEEPW